MEKEPQDSEEKKLKEVTYDKRTGDILSLVGGRLYMDNKTERASSAGAIKYMISENGEDVVNMCSFASDISRMLDKLNDLSGFDYPLQHDVIGGFHQGWPKIDTELSLETGTTFKVDKGWWVRLVKPVSDGLDISEKSAVRVIIYYGLFNIKNNTTYFKNDRAIGKDVEETWYGISDRMVSINLFYDLLRREFCGRFQFTKTRLLNASRSNMFTWHYADNIAGTKFEERLIEESGEETVENIRCLVEEDLGEKL